MKITKGYNYLRTRHWHYNKDYSVFWLDERFDHINNFIAQRGVYGMNNAYVKKLDIYSRQHYT